MKRFSLLATLLFVAALTGTAQARSSDVTDPKAPRNLPVEGPIEVSWTDPAQFSELRYSGNRWEARQGDWVVQLAKHLRKRAARDLPQGERLDVTITDIKRAGSYEPWRGARFNSTRIVRDIYPPRITLEFTRTGADGRVIAQGERKLTDMGFLMNIPPAGSSDLLRYEKRLIDDWLSKEFKKPIAAR